MNQELVVWTLCNALCFFLGSWVSWRCHRPAETMVFRGEPASPKVEENEAEETIYDDADLDEALK